MKHRPFEDWLFADEPLNPEETVALGAHLQSCEACCRLSQAWKEVDTRLQAAPPLAPQPGFSNRWLSRLEADRQRLQRRQSLAMLSFSIGGAMLLLGSLVILALPVLQSPEVLFWNWIYRIMELLTFANSAQNLLSVVLPAASGDFSWVWMALIVGLLSELAVLWIVSLRWLTNPRRVTQ